MLYWGAQGVNRDVTAALEYYRQAAESGDPVALYDYGIVILKVSGVRYTTVLVCLFIHS